jgi:hypothetical protein
VPSGWWCGLLLDPLLGPCCLKIQLSMARLDAINDISRMIFAVKLDRVSQNRVALAAWRLQVTQHALSMYAACATKRLVTFIRHVQSM